MSVTEIRLHGLPFANAFKEIRDLVNEAMFITDLQTRHPPLAHVRMVSVRDVDRTPAADDALVAVVEVFEAMQVVQVPLDRSVLAVDLEGVKRLMATGVARRFEESQ